MLIKILQIIFNNIMIWGSGSVLAATVPVLYINYDIESNLHANINVLYKNNSEVKLVDGFKGRGLYLNNNCVSLELEKYGLSGEGTIAFWVKPEWDYYNNVEGDLVSHTFASMKWSDGGYFVISDGWWEKSGGALYTYFVFNNKEYMHTHSKILYKKDEWMHLAVSWNSSKGVISMYQNGEFVATRNKAFTSGKYAQQIVIGCDQSTGLFGERWMNG